MADSNYNFTYGPYQSADGALQCFMNFQMLAFSVQRSRSWGIVWAERGQAKVLRSPTFDQDGNGLALVYEWRGPIPPPPVPPAPSTGGESWYSAIKRHLTGGVQDFQTGASYLGSQARQALGFAHNVVVDNPKTLDTINVALDLYGVVSSGVVVGISAVAAVTGVGAVPGAVAVAASMAALVSTSALFVADGRHLYLEVTADDKAVKAWEQTPFYDKTEKFAPIIALFDPAREAVAVVKSARSVTKLTPEVEAATRASTAAAANLAQATAQVDRETSMIAKVQTLIDKPGHVASEVDKTEVTKLQAQKVAAQTNAAQADVSAKEAALKLAALTDKVKELREDIDKYMALRVHFRDATLVRDLPMNAWSMALYSVNCPFSSSFGEHVDGAGTLHIDRAVAALIPHGFNIFGRGTLDQFIHISVVGVGGSQKRR